MDITLRRAMPQDKPRIIEISSQIWDGEDYVPDVIDEWLTDENAELVVALRGGQVVAFARYVWLLPGHGPAQPGYAWFEGIRTDPAAQNRGIGKAITRYFLDQVARAGAQRAALWTYLEDPASIHIVEAHGFRQVARFVYLEARDSSPARAAARLSEQVEAVDETEAAAFVRDSSFLVTSRGWFPHRWRFYPFARCAGTARLPIPPRPHADGLGQAEWGDGWRPRAQHVIGIREGDQLVALLCAGLPFPQRPHEFSIDYVDGPAQHIETLVRHALYLARERQMVLAIVPRWGDESARALDVLRGLGFEAPHGFQEDMFVYEREIRAT